VIEGGAALQSGDCRRALAAEQHVSASTQNQALGALLFLYRHVLDDPLPWLKDVVRAVRPEYQEIAENFRRYSMVGRSMPAPNWTESTLARSSGTTGSRTSCITKATPT
jgi:hypothetical protein